MFSQLTSWVHANPYEFTMLVMGANYVYSAAVSTMPTPLNPNSFYAWFFNFNHLLSGAVGRIVASKFGNGGQNGTKINGGNGSSGITLNASLSQTGSGNTNPQPGQHL